MFGKILIANRGEIACRIIKTARRLGIATVAVYSDADRDARHVEMADEAVHIGPAPAAQSYLMIDNILEACRKTGAEAVHPGYGFLSERAAFAEALATENIAFIGPNVGAIAAMGDKIESKRFARAAGVSTVPGNLEIIKDGADAARIAADIGFPVMIKASAGGGGKGMRIARSAGEVEEGFARAKSEAKSSFGDDRIFIEKFIENPRHVEIQIIGDKHGHVIHLGERECSIQRRNQKIIEEAPSPLLDAATRELMGAQAVALAQAVGYDSAGTVEFVAGQDRSFYFLEMNTRLQVEHPVTELITGLDLVELMIRSAAGEPLPLAQEDVRLSGWAVESRVYAEDPTRGFLPSIGRLTTYRPPAEGKFGELTIRNDTGVAEGGEIAIHYDPMIAKLVTHAPTRSEAIHGHSAALDAFALDGIRHNIPFLSSLMSHPRWREGRLSTGFIAEEYPEGFANPAPAGAIALRLAAIAGAIDHQLNQRKRRISGQMPVAKAVTFERRRHVVVGAEDFAFEIDETPKGLNLAFEDGRLVSVLSLWKPGEPVWRGVVDGERIAAQVRPILNGVLLAHGGFFAEARVYTQREAELVRLMPEKRAADSGKHLLCPMPGLIREVLVSEGQAVKAGEALAIVEAMKMENILRAERDATIGKVYAAAGQSLAVDAVIMDFAA
ncbi:Carbamoyl-phosphate synthase L chain ATP-binding [Methylocella silvestris BL2]|uniref:propionyl-CoA carboxylase n=1 Tax=Methylocella silvestris (strain DSM 15510 / CIP 108128 / LMG 27833 / NCIMB 13906 / BL2) TaxID=395965 RepID=B8EJH6_METSB|nr:acetyl/propionyl/methylcrotonyl-CoA carboxylase subunit alpha [Methylocella silvestris]ACK52668.1 Carbamoyl-phosphate synthase L chain ATP-binding [Methylocella silvestris BL2]